MKYKIITKHVQCDRGKCCTLAQQESGQTVNLSAPIGEDYLCHSELVSESLTKQMLKRVQHDKNKKAAFTLTEVLLACVIVGVISALILPVFISKYQAKSFDLGFEREIKSLNNALDILAITENKDYFKTMMYVAETPETYEENSGEFLKKYLKLSKYCGENNGDCFAPVYYKYENKDKSVYNPEFKGACGSLKNGSSICLTPQIGAESPKVLVDINGKKGPNVLGKDLRTFELNLKTRTALNTTTQDVLTTDASYELNNTINCQKNPQSLACCEYQGITEANKSYCCSYSEFTNNIECCRQRGLGSITSDTDACCSIVPEFADNGNCKTNKCAHDGIFADNAGWTACLKVLPGSYN